MSKIIRFQDGDLHWSEEAYLDYDPANYEHETRQEQAIELYYEGVCRENDEDTDIITDTVSL